MIAAACRARPSPIHRGTRCENFLRFLVCAAFVALACAGCSGDDDNPVGPPPAYTSIVITGGPDSLLIGESGAFTATVIDTRRKRRRRACAHVGDERERGREHHVVRRATGQTEGDVWCAPRAAGSSRPRALAVLQGFGWVDQSAAASTIQTLRGVWFVTRYEGWAVGDLGTILHTTNTGKSWTSRPRTRPRTRSLPSRSSRRRRASRSDRRAGSCAP
jgi:hypothetical protein